MVFVYVLWMSVFLVAQMLLTSTIEEKSKTVDEIDGLLAGLAYLDRLSKLRKKMFLPSLSVEQRREVSAKYYKVVCQLSVELIENGQVPKGGQAEVSFWRNAMYAANSAWNPDLLEKAIEINDSGNSRMKPYFDRMRRRAQELRGKQGK